MRDDGERAPALNFVEHEERAGTFPQISTARKWLRTPGIDFAFSFTVPRLNAGHPIHASSSL
jgi:hypothetical protein